ncbi:MAG: PAS domain-containing protein, partial [Acidobacteriota bacterium]
MVLEQQAAKIVRDTSRSTGRDFVRSLAGSLAEALDVRYCMATECLDSPPTRVQTIAFWADGELQADFEYGLLTTPCERVIDGEACVYGRGIRALFPEDDDLVTLDAESYAAVPLLDRHDQVLGHLVVMDSRPFGDDFSGLLLLQFFADRVAAEMERARAHTELVHSESRLRQVIDLVPHFLFAKDRDGRFILANQALADAFDTTPKELLGKTDQDFVASPEAVERFRRDDLAVIDSGTVREIEEELVDHRGETRVLQTTKIPFTFANSELPSVLGVAIDVTRQRRLEAHRRELQEQILHVQKLESLGVLAGGLAHDFNNLLTSILGNVHLMEEHIGARHPTARHLREIELAARRSAELIGQMLAYSGKGTFHVAPLDLNQTILELAGLLERSVSKKVRLRFDLASDLPAVVADATQIRQVVMNMITNASEAYEGRAGSVRVTTALRRTDRTFLDAAYLAADLEPGEYVAVEVE